MTSLLRKYYRKAKNEWNSYSEIQVLVREATSNDPWGPSSTIMSRVARESESPANYHMMFTTLWKRLVDYQHIRHVVKSLQLIEYLLKHSHERFINDVRLRSDVIRRLKHYKYFDEGRDIGGEVRHKAQAVMTLLENNEFLNKERAIAKETDGRIRGMSYEYGREEEDPFGENRLRIEYKPEGASFNEYEDININDRRPVEEDYKSEEVENIYEQEEKPKKKSLKKKRSSKKKAKKVEKEPEPELEEEEVERDNDSDEDGAEGANYPPKYAFSQTQDILDGEDKEEDFLMNLNAAPKASKYNDNSGVFGDTDLITGGYNPNAEAQLGWLTLTAAQTYTPAEDLALFDAPKPAAAEKPAPKAEGSDLLDFGVFDTKKEEKVAAPAAPVDAWEAAKNLTVLDNLRVTPEELAMKQSLEARKEKMNNGPKLKDLAKQAREQRDETNPFDALVKGAQEGSYAPGASMALVPVGQYYDPNAYNQALVPVNPYGGYGYPMPGYPPMYPYGQDPYGYGAYPPQRF